MPNSLKKTIVFLFAIILIGQLLFIFASKKYTMPKYESKLFTTIGIAYKSGDDLHRLHEAAHHFGQTMSGWVKFPNFKSNLIKYANLPAEANINMHMQERQNFIFTVNTKKAPIKLEQIKKVKNFLQIKLNDFNTKTKTGFILTNAEYQQVITVRSYTFGALFTLALSMIAGLGLLFIRKEFL